MDRAMLLSGFDAAIAACDPERSVRRVVSFEHGRCVVDGADLGAVPPDGIVVVGLGKAAPAMARGVAAVGLPVRGLVVSDHVAPCPVDLFVSDHPIPGDRSFEAGRMLQDLVTATHAEDIIVYLISGGGSALAEVPAPGIDIEDVAAVNHVLTTSGIPIEAMNEVRAAISAIKAGRLAAMAGSRAQTTIVIVDVPTGSLDRVASGPSIPSDLGSRAAAVVRSYGLTDRLPERVIAALPGGAPRVTSATSPVVEVASPRIAAEAARHTIAVGPLTDEPVILVGETEGAVRSLVSGLGPGEVRVAAGETVLAVRGSGVGGRNQHAALIASLIIEGTDVVFGAFGTDGIDGPTPAAGAIVDGGTVGRIRAGGMDPIAAIASFDSHEALALSGDLVVTGPTGTNVADLWMVGR